MTGWTDSPCVWRSWKCQLLRAERTATDVVVDAVALERLPSATIVAAAGTPFAIRVARDDVNAAAGMTGWFSSARSGQFARLTATTRSNSRRP